MAWVILVVAGIFETAWAIGLKYTHGFTRPVPSVLTVAAIAISMYLLAVAARTLPIGTAYAVWVGIGAAGTVVLGVVLFGEPMNLLRGLFLAMLLGGIVGLKATAGPSAGTQPQPPTATGATEPGASEREANEQRDIAPPTTPDSRP